MGDGESMEGNVWEALNFAGKYLNQLFFTKYAAFDKIFSKLKKYYYLNSLCYCANDINLFPAKI